MSVYLVLFVFLGIASTVYGDCPRPTGKEHMQLITDVTFPAPDGTQVTFTCEPGYMAKGSGTVTCSNGQWSILRRICEIRNCGSYGEVDNGHVDYSEGTEFGATIRAVCNDGYTPVPKDSTAYCGVNGWEDRIAVCDPILCYAPNEIANGYFSPVNPSYHYGEVVQYTCNGKYVLNGSATLTCTNEVFTPEPPNCVLVNCNAPKVNNGAIVSGSRPPYTYQSSVTFGCNTGYKINGSSTVSCTINSEWSQIPNCTEIQCNAPKIPNLEVDGKAKDIYKFYGNCVAEVHRGI
ncbi:C4b-binding protein alpha chain-like [Boleophthalmus pectinirostris]|uniref:C4b-binding protein alpha chain-like n=1 Tax=Boleophthalmus pectinirostris TaxID=150288 RepID=UPI00242A3CA8|nr:C4b-binding protein alpha chain-like [Boleophthalmus pectinirostris]